MYARRASSILAACFALPMFVVACGSESAPVAISSTTTATAEEVAAQSAAPSTENESQSPNEYGGQPTGIELYTKACLSALEFFAGFREMAEDAGQSFDATAAAEEMMNAVGETSSADDELVWAELSAADQAQFKRGVYAAANGKC